MAEGRRPQRAESETVKRVVRYQRQGQITSFDTAGEKEETLECVMQ
jgi:hypothetical protein